MRTSVTSRGITLGRPVDLLFDSRLGQAVGFEVHCVDGLRRFLPWLACRPTSRSIEARSPLSLLETGEAEFYRREGVSLRELHRRGVATGGRVDDVDLDVDGRVVLVRLRVDAADGGSSRR